MCGPEDFKKNKKYIEFKIILGKKSRQQWSKVSDKKWD